MSIRFCHPRNFKNLIEYDRENNRFDGLMSDVLTSAFYTVSETLNLTVEIQADDIGVGAYREDLNRYDGCLGNIQMNHSDAILQMNPYPIDIEGVSQGLIFYETSLQFISAYNKTEIGGSAQMLDSFNGFDGDIWSTCMFTWLLMSLFLVAEETMYRWLQSSGRKTNCNSIYQVVTHCTRFGSMNDGGLPRRLMFLSASMFALLILNYFSSMIKTDLVTVKDPLVFKSYDDIIERGAIPLFMKGQSYNTLFSGPDAEPYRKKLWNYAVNRFGERRMYVDLSAFSFLIMCLSVVKQKVIVLLDESIMPIVRTSGCSLASRDLSRLPRVSQNVKDPQQFSQLLSLGGINGHEKQMMLDYARENDLILYSEPEVLVHITRDPHEQSYNQGLIYTAQNVWLRKHLEKCTRRMLEAGWISKQMHGLGEIDLFHDNQKVEAISGPSSPDRQQAVEQCKSKSIVKPAVKFQAIKLINFQSLFLLTGSLYFALCILMACEILWKKLMDDLIARPQASGRPSRRGRSHIRQPNPVCEHAHAARRHSRSAGLLNTR